MASEFEIIDNPTSTPEAVSTGYQAQNKNLIAQRNGFDLTVMTPTSGADVILHISGPVDVNGVMYNCKEQVTLTPDDGAGRYVVVLIPGVNGLTPTLVKCSEGYASFHPDKNAHYTTAGYRILDWNIWYDGSVSYVASENYGDRITEYIFSSQDWIAPFSKYYDIEMCGRGGDGGDALGVGATSSGGSGASYGRKKIFIEAGTKWSSAFSSASNGNLTFSKSGLSLVVRNGTKGQSVSGRDVIATTPTAGQTYSSGMNLTIAGGDGSRPIFTNIDMLAGVYQGVSYYSKYRGGVGGGSYLAEQVEAPQDVGNGKNGKNYGGGGSGAPGGILSSFSGGTGGAGIIIIHG